MPKRIPEENQRRFVELLDACLTKSGRKRVELARACHWDASMVTKVLNLQARPNLAVFYQFMAPFLVAHGGITHARQVIEMAELLGGELDEADLLAVATAAERHHDPYQSQAYFRERADRFRQTISATMTRPEHTATDTELGSHPISQAVATENETDTLSTLQSIASVESSDELILGPTTDTEPPEELEQAVAASLVHWQSVLSDVLPPAPGDGLDPDEVIATILEWESQLADPEIARSAWDWLGEAGRFEKLRQKSRLEFVLRRCDGAATWNCLEWEWFDSQLLETARRHAGQTQLSPRQLAAFVADLGQVAFEAVKQNDGKAPSLVINLNDVRANLPIVQGANWDWLRHIAQAGPIRLSLQDNGVCQFVSREEAEYLAAQYLLQEATDDDIHRFVQNSGRPFGVLRQMVRVLHFTGRDQSVQAIIEGLLGISEVIPLRYLDAADLLAACEAPSSIVLAPLWAQVEEALCQSWAEIDAPEYQAAIAQVMRQLHSKRFGAILRQTLVTGPMWGAALRDLATLGGVGALETLRAVAASARPDNGPGRQPLSAVLSVAHNLPPTDEAALLTALALREAEYDEQWRAVSALAKAGTIPALRALHHIAGAANHPKTRRYAETRLDLLYRPAQAAMTARELDEANLVDDNDAVAFHGLLQRAKSLLHSSVTVRPDESSRATAENPSRTLSRALARVWSNLHIDESFRVEVALSLVGTHAWPAFAICLGALPLVDVPDHKWASLTERLLVTLAPKTAAPWLWQLLDKAFTPAQSAVIIRCLGRSGGIALDERFERLLTHPDETITIAAVGALADSLGQAAEHRLWQIVEAGHQPGVRAAAFEGLAVIGSEKALPYLKEKLSSPDRHADACFQLARLHHPDAEQLLAQTAQAVAKEMKHYLLYLPALAISGGPKAIQAIYDLLGPRPNELTLTHLRDQFADDTATRAKDVWNQLVNDASPDWRMTAADVLARDKTHALIEQVVRLALEDQDRRVCEFARRCLRWHAPTISSLAATEYVLDRLEPQVIAFALVDEYLLGLLQRCLSGLALKGQDLPAEIVQRTLALLRPLLSHARSADKRINPLLAVFAYPEFGEAAGEVAQLLDQAMEANVQRQALDTLIAMHAPGLYDVFVSLARSSGWREIREHANFCLAEMADFRSLLDLLDDLKSILYRVAIRKDVRFQSDLFHRRLILTNGQRQRI